jgi:serine/threonine-protein kinase
MSRWHALDTKLEEFEAAWRRGSPPDLRAFLPLPPADRTDLLHELIKLDLEYRWRLPAKSERWLLEEYLRRFPELGPLSRLPDALLREEYGVRLGSGECPDPAEYARRFGRSEAAVRALLQQVDAEHAAEKVRAERFQQAQSELIPGVPPLQMPGELLAALQRHRLLASRRLEELERQHRSRPFPSIKLLAEHLLQQNWLTPFQANLIVRGRAQDLVLGPYIVQERIGQGAMGRVYKAVHQQLGRVAAIKVIRPDLVKGWDSDSLARFCREMQAAGRLSHPNVVHAYDAGPLGPTYFLAMEYLDGIDLARLVQRSGPVPVGQACDFIRQAALGLQHAFERGLIHRDVKPANLLVVSQGVGGSGVHKLDSSSMTLDSGDSTTDSCLLTPVVKVLDLGLARLLLSETVRSSSGLTREGTMIGTVDYMAPEQADDPHRADIRADLYSLGCTFYFLLVGKPPFPDGNVLQKLNRHKSEAAVLPTKLPPALAGVLRRLLAKRPEERFQTPAELAAALAGHVPPDSASLSPHWGITSQRPESEARSGNNVEVLPPVPMARDERSRRRWLILLGAIAACLFLGLTSVLVLALSQQSRRVVSGSTPGTTEPRADTTPHVLHFDGIDDFVSLPDGLLSEPPPLTVEASFRTRRDGVILGQQNLPYPENKDEDHFATLYVNTEGRLFGGMWMGPLGIGGGPTVNDDRWHHAALVVEAGVQRLYLDGEEIAVLRGTLAAHRMVTNQIGIGCTRNWAKTRGDWFPFEGEIREIRFWKITRTPAQLKQFANLRLRGSERGLIAYYPLDEASGDTALDQTRQRRHGLLGNGSAASKPERRGEVSP